ncbi:MAG: ABC transporter ATP-binding protein [Crocinitomicaceae bacterium]|nr:ABC transporter ATP-binding protein [Flavobacteriales bacterium]NQZ34214.1 ABC transporter ATP-binding protein [Crocinitomicaceae bacterium]
MIELKNLHIGYSESILECENIKLECGEVYVLVGKNGIGKSTLLKTLSKQISAKSGQILLEGKEIRQVSTSELPKLLSFVPIHFPHMDYVRAREFISAGRAPYTNAMGKLTETDSEEIQHAIDLLEIKSLANRFTSQLSDGEKQLVAIAKAVAQKTPIILLDEPTAFLDYSNKKKVLGLLKETVSKLNKCIVLSAHDIDLCLEFASKFLIVNSTTRKLELHTSPTKAELLKIAFHETS